jgi:hypothetical protein
MIELHILGGTLRFGSATELNTYVEDTSGNMPTRSIRMMERNNTQINDVKASSGNVVEIPAERLNDLLVAAATAITDIDNVINELQAARDYLEGETERVWRANARYAHLAKTASASAKSITENMGKWRNPEPLSVPPSVDASTDPEAQPEVNESWAYAPAIRRAVCQRRALFFWIAPAASWVHGDELGYNGGMQRQPRVF